MKTVENSYALASSVRDLNCRGIHLRWSFSLSLFDQRGSSAESGLTTDGRAASGGRVIEGFVEGVNPVIVCRACGETAIRERRAGADVHDGLAGGHRVADRVNSIHVGSGRRIGGAPHTQIA